MASPPPIATDLDIRIELLTAAGAIDRVVAQAANIPVGRGAFRAAVALYGASGRLRMRHGARIVEKYPVDD